MFGRLTVRVTACARVLAPTAIAGPPSTNADPIASAAIRLGVRREAGFREPRTAVRDHHRPIAAAWQVRTTIANHGCQRTRVLTPPGLPSAAGSRACGRPRRRPVLRAGVRARRTPSAPKSVRSRRSIRRATFCCAPRYSCARGVRSTTFSLPFVADGVTTAKPRPTRSATIFPAPCREMPSSRPICEIVIPPASRHIRSTRPSGNRRSPKPASAIPSSSRCW